jgi:hydroxymethylpyrimidine/phosphomethylpyrimidine kinase
LRSSLPVALTVAGSDSIAGAGLQADLKTFAALGVYGVTAVSAVTAQSTLAVSDILVLPEELVRSQIDEVAGDVQIAAIKTGMLGAAPIVRTVAEAVARLHLVNLVVDPVITATSTPRTLLATDAVSVMKGLLLPLAAIVTPNASEAMALSGVRVDSISTARDAARRIADLGPRAVLIKGGHLTGADSVDLLFHAGTFTEYAAPRAALAAIHGTGCTFASAAAAGLALGDDIPAAIQRAKEFVTGAIQHSLEIGHGARILDHFWAQR